MAKLLIEMPNLLNFPMGKLYYDLVLEVIDELDPKDVPELMKVERRFRRILLQKPARIFGKQIHSIHIHTDERWEDRYGNKTEYRHYYDLVSIKKFPGSTPRDFDLWSQNVLLWSQVERCSVLKISELACHNDGKELPELKKVFANLKQVDKLDVWITGNNFNDCLENLKAEIIHRALLKICPWKEAQQQKLLLPLISGSLQNCKMITIRAFEFYPTVYSALSKTQLELFVAEIWGNESTLELVELILNFGIPSENKEAACLVLRRGIEIGIENRIKNLPEIRHVNERNETFIRDTMKGVVLKPGVPIHDGRIDRPINCYWKRIDGNRDCIYAVNDCFFFAKYVPLTQF